MQKQPPTLTAVEVDLERAEVRRYTDADQQAEYPGDRFFEFVPALQEAEIRLPNQ